MEGIGQHVPENAAIQYFGIIVKAHKPSGAKKIPGGEADQKIVYQRVVFENAKHNKCRQQK